MVNKLKNLFRYVLSLVSVLCLQTTAIARAEDPFILIADDGQPWLVADGNRHRLAARYARQGELVTYPEQEPVDAGRIASLGRGMLEELPFGNAQIRSAAKLGSMSNPWPVGSTVAVAGDWELSVVSFRPDSTRELIAFNTSINKEPKSGYQYVILKIRFKNIGSEPTEFRPSERLRLMGNLMVPYRESDHTCGIIPENVATGGYNVMSSKAYPGGAINGNLCWEVPSQEVDSLFLIDEGNSNISSVKSETIFLALK